MPYNSPPVNQQSESAEKKNMAQMSQEDATYTRAYIHLFTSTQVTGLVLLQIIELAKKYADMLVFLSSSFAFTSHGNLRSNKTSHSNRFRNTFKEKTKTLNVFNI